MKEFWDERYSREEYVYGQEPNAYFREFLDSSGMAPGRLLLPGEGEGRNAVYAALKGWSVDAFDQSTAGREKALKLAGDRKVAIRYEVADVREYPFTEGAYDLLGLFFFHLPGELRAFAHPQFVKALKPGGTLIAELFSPDQLGRKSGGPQHPDLLYSIETLKSDFGNLEIQHISEEIIHLEEGDHHQGEAAVVRLIGKKSEE